MSVAREEARLARLQDQLAAEGYLAGMSWRRAATELAAAARAGRLDAVRALARAFEDSPDRRVREICEAALLDLRTPLAKDAVCSLAVESGSDSLLTVIAAAGYVPADPALRAALLVLGGRWEELAIFDLDGAYLGIAYETATTAVRARLAAAAREAGQARWVQVAAGGRQGRRLGEMSAFEWRAAIAILALPERNLQAWELAKAAPPRWSRDLLLAMQDASALPEEDRESFADLRAMAGECRIADLALCTVLTQHEQQSTPPTTPRLDRFATLERHAGAVTSLALDLHGELLAVATDDGKIWLWRVPDRQCIMRLPSSAVSALALAPDGRLLAACDPSARLIHVPEGQYAAGTSDRAEVRAAAFSPDGGLVATWSKEVIGVWDVLQDKPVARHVGQLLGYSACLTVTPDGRLSGAYSGNKDRIYFMSAGDARHHQTRREKRDSPKTSLRSPQWAGIWHNEYDWVFSLAIHDDGRRRLVASGYRDGTICLDAERGFTSMQRCSAGESPVTALAFNGDGNMMASGDSAGNISLWRSELATFSYLPTAALFTRHGFNFSLRGEGATTAGESAWTRFMSALLKLRIRHSIHVEAAQDLEASEFDIEIGE